MGVEKEGDEWQMMWGVRVRRGLDCPDDILKDAIDSSRRVLQGCQDFEAEGESLHPLVWQHARIKADCSRLQQKVSARASCKSPELS
jgi:hypothetical protein